MSLLELVKKNRSYRRFYQDSPVATQELELMVEAARLCPSGRNAQPLKYILCNLPQMNEKIFSTLAWAGYLTDWDGPVEGERPAAYIVQLLDKNIATNPLCDHGIAVQALLLQAVELGYGGCIVASVKRESLAKMLNLSPNMEILQVIALGVPKEEVVIEPMANNDCKYWRDNLQIHHVPKRALNEIIIESITSEKLS